MARQLPTNTALCNAKQKPKTSSLMTAANCINPPNPTALNAVDLILYG
jgi:hypothetical protein